MARCTCPARSTGHFDKRLGVALKPLNGQCAPVQWGRTGLPAITINILSIVRNTSAFHAEGSVREKMSRSAEIDLLWRRRILGQRPAAVAIDESLESRVRNRLRSLKSAKHQPIELKIFSTDMGYYVDLRCPSDECPHVDFPPQELVPSAPSTLGTRSGSLDELTHSSIMWWIACAGIERLPVRPQTILRLTLLASRACGLAPGPGRPYLTTDKAKSN